MYNTHYHLLVVVCKYLLFILMENYRNLNAQSWFRVYCRNVIWFLLGLYRSSKGCKSWLLWKGILGHVRGRANKQHSSFEGGRQLFVQNRRPSRCRQEVLRSSWKTWAAHAEVCSVCQSRLKADQSYFICTGIINAAWCFSFCCLGNRPQETMNMWSLINKFIFVTY